MPKPEREFFDAARIPRPPVSPRPHARPDLPRRHVRAFRPPGTPHGPWRTGEGCTTFEIRDYRK